MPNFTLFRRNQYVLFDLRLSISLMKPSRPYLWTWLFCLVGSQTIWAATPIKIGFPLEVALGVKSSVELQFPTEVGKIYQVEVSSDLKTWANDGYAMVGKGVPQTFVTSTWNLPNLFFRVRDNGDPGRVLAGNTPGPPGPQGPAGPTGQIPTDYATSAQGAKADTALQADDLGSAGARLLATETIPDVRDILAGKLSLTRTTSRILRDRQTTYAPYKITVIAAGDSFAPDLGAQIHLRIAPLAADGMDYIFIRYLTERGATAISEAFQYSPNGQHCLLNNPGDALIFPKEAINAYRFHVFYTTETDVSGTFTIQARTRGGEWADLPGGVDIQTNVLNPNGVPVGAGVFTYSFPTTMARQIRAVCTSGTVRILGITRSDIWETSSPKGGLASYNLGFTSQTVKNASRCPQAVFNTIIGTLKPDIASFKVDDNVEQLGYLQTYIDKWNTAWPTDWILFSSHPTRTTPTRDLTPEDRVVQAVAETNGYTFINCRRIFGSLSEMTARGFLNPDEYHLSPYGDWVMQRYTHEILENSIRPQADYIAPTYFEGNADSEVLSYTNAMGTGGVPARVWSAQYNATNGSFQFNIGPAGSGRFGWGPAGNLFITGGNYGWGYSNPPGKALRAPRATAEIFADDWNTNPVLTLSAKSNHQSDALEIVDSATQASAGSRTAGIKPSGAADFTALKVSINQYPNHASADSDGTLSSGQFYKLQGERTVYQKP